MSTSPRAGRLLETRASVACVCSSSSRSLLLQARVVMSCALLSALSRCQLRRGGFWPRRRRRRFVIFVLTSFLRRAPSRINPSRTQHQQSMNAIANVGRASKDVVAMSKEMFKMGIIEDVLEDTLATSTHFSNTEEDEETDAEVDAILKEIAGEVRVTLPEPSVAEAKTSKATVEADATSSSFAAAAKENNAQPAKVLPEGGNDPGSIIDENTTRDMQSRLDALRE